MSEAERLADDLDAEFVTGRVSNHTGRKAAAELRRLSKIEAEVEALQKWRDEADILATYSRNDGRREWVNVGTWLRPGEIVAHMSARPGGQG